MTSAHRGLPSRHALLRDHAIQAIRNAIVDGRFRPGQQLRDRDVQEWLGISRTPIREAFLALEHDGLIETQPNRSVRVVDPRGADATCALQTLGVLMRGILRTAGQLLATKRVAVTSIIDDTVARLEHEDVRALNRTSAAGYRGWVELTPNPLLATQCHRVMDGLALRVRITAPFDEVPWQHLITTNRSLRRAVEDGQVADATAAIERMHRLTP